MAQGKPFRVNIAPATGMAVDVVTIDGVQYVHDGSSEPPENSSWVRLEFSSAPATMTISVTFSECTDDSGIPDKYKAVVTASVSGTGGTVRPASQKVVKGASAKIDIEPNEDMAVDTITVGDDVYINDGQE